MSDSQPALPNRQTPFSEAFKAFIPQGWTEYDRELPDRKPAADAAIDRREAISRQFPGDRLVLPAGGLRIRSNDSDYRFRAHTAFAHLTGLGEDREPDAVLVLEPVDVPEGGDGAAGEASSDGPGAGHRATLYFKPRAPRTDSEFYASARYGEMWVGQRESLAEMAALTGIDCAPIEELDDALAKNAADSTIRVVADADVDVQQRIDELRSEVDVAQRSTLDDELVVALSELRLVKDAFEIEQMREACRLTADGFEAVVADLPEAVRRGRGERWVEGIFGLHARHAANGNGYDSIAAAGDHACTLHWIRNDGDLREGDLLLLDAGVELETLYTADVTRTLPVNGRFSEPQRRVYAAVLAAQDAAIAAAQPGASFADVHAAAIAVIAEHLQDWDLLPVTAAESLDSETGGHHRRWMVHGTSHHLGMDVHDCAQARQENYRQGTLAPGMVITVEPGLYFKGTDELVPEELRGIGVRIEDDILITADGNENLSGMLPRTADDVEAWMAPLLAGPATSGS